MSGRGNGWPEVWLVHVKHPAAENPWCGQGFSLSKEPKSPNNMMLNNFRLGLARFNIARGQPDPKASPI